MNRLLSAGGIAAALVMVLSAPSNAQLRRLRVVSPDSQPIVYAYVTIGGGTGQITDQSGELSLGAGKSQTLTVSIKRIGFQPWFGKLELSDTAEVLTVALQAIAQKLAQVQVSGSGNTLSLPMRGFYDRWMMRQKGVLSATFIGPEEIEFRHPNKITNMLNGLSGVMLKRGCRGGQEAYTSTGSCKMAVVVDGVQQCPSIGCKNDFARPCPCTGRPGACDPDQDKVMIDDILDAGSVAAIEVYGRGGNMPVSLQVDDARCGVIALWTGSRKP